MFYCSICNIVLKKQGTHWRKHFPDKAREVSRKMSISHTGRPTSRKGKTWEEEYGVDKAAEMRVHASNLHTGMKYSTESRARRSLAFSGKNNPNYGKSLSSGAKEKLRIKSKERWQTAEFVQKQMRARGVSPNKIELKFEVYLQQELGLSYKYVGDGQFILAGKCPDFINTNGQKKLIELYGDYWHKGEDPQPRIDLFKQYGYETLIVWEHELEEIELKEKILAFEREK